jgi:hypothetical protein
MKRDQILDELPVTTSYRQGFVSLVQTWYDETQIKRQKVGTEKAKSVLPAAESVLAEEKLAEKSDEKHNKYAWQLIQSSLQVGMTIWIKVCVWEKKPISSGFEYWEKMRWAKFTLDEFLPPFPLKDPQDVRQFWQALKIVGHLENPFVYNVHNPSTEQLVQHTLQRELALNFVYEPVSSSLAMYSPIGFLFRQFYNLNSGLNYVTILWDRKMYHRDVFKAACFVFRSPKIDLILFEYRSNN